MLDWWKLYGPTAAVLERKAGEAIPKNDIQLRNECYFQAWYRGTCGRMNVTECMQALTRFSWPVRTVTVCAIVTGLQKEEFFSNLSQHA